MAKKDQDARERIIKAATEILNEVSDIDTITVRQISSGAARMDGISAPDTALRLRKSSICGARTRSVPARCRRCPSRLLSHMQKHRPTPLSGGAFTP